jgi:hypothetical protein
MIANLPTSLANGHTLSPTSNQKAVTSMSQLKLRQQLNPRIVIIRKEWGRRQSIRRRLSKFIKEYINAKV